MILNTAKFSLLIYLLLKPFYLFSSGGLQPADLFLLISAGLYVLNVMSSRQSIKEFTDAIKKHKYFLIFAFLTLVINAAYFLFFPEFKFILSSLYFIFNSLAILTFSVFLTDGEFLKRVGAVLKFNLLVQLLLWVANIGRYYNTERYMGTFNDPNQFAYYILLSFLFIFIIDWILMKHWTVIFFIPALLLIIESGSTGILLGFVVFTVLLVAVTIRQQWTTSYDILRKIIYAGTASLIVAIPLLVLWQGYSSRGVDSFAEILVDESLALRVEEKVTKASGESDISLWEDRGYDTIAKYPQYVLIGSGEGAFERFIGVTNNFNKEIHSTFPSILFYYGIIPFIILMMWLYRQLKGINSYGFVVLAALLIVSFILLNQRQSLFWVLIILIGMSADLRYKMRPGNAEIKAVKG